MRRDHDPGNREGNKGDKALQLQCATPDNPWPPPLPASQARFRPSYEALAAGLLADRGGAEAVTTAELALIETTAECYVVTRKLARRLFTEGVTKKGGDLKPALASYFTAVNSLRLNLLAIGLDRRARDLSHDLRDLWDGQGGTDRPDRAAPGRAPASAGERATEGDQARRAGRAEPIHEKAST